MLLACEQDRFTQDNSTKTIEYKGIIELVYQNGNVFVFDVKAWTLLRHNRIVGEFLGLRYQTAPALPLKLLPEEVFSLISRNLAVLVQYEQEVSELHVDYFNGIEKKLLEAEKAMHKTLKKDQLESYINNIVAGKRKKGDLRSAVEILDEVVDKAVEEIKSDNMIWPVLTQIPEELKKERSINTITLNQFKALTNLNTRFCEIFQDLWDRRLYLTRGNQFGGNYLGYKGHPLIYHASFIIHCLNQSEKISLRELVAWGRLGSSVKKQVVLSTVKEGQVKHLTLSWLNS